jgi:hypothetical protein
MSDFLHTAIPVEVGGKQWVLRFTLRALSEIKKATGQNPLAAGGLVEKLDSDADPDVLALFIWALLWREDPRPSVDEIMDSIGMADLGRIMEAVRLAFTQNAPEVRADEAGPPMEGSLPQ